MNTPAYWTELAQWADPEVLANVTHGTVTMADGYPINVYQMGNPQAEKLLIINSLGLPFFLVARLGLALCRRFHVIGWDHRGSPDTAAAFDSADATIAQQASDVAGLQRHFGDQIAHVVTWSSGAFALLEAMRTGGVAFKRHILLAPSDLSSFENRTPFQKFFYPLFVKAAGGESAAIEKLRRMISATQNSSGDDASQQLATAYTRSTEATRRYVLYFQSVLDFREQARAIYASLGDSARFLIIHSLNDTYADYRGSVAACEEVGNTKLILNSSGGHFHLYQQPQQIAADITAYISSDEAPQTATAASQFSARLAAA